jgi:hypothetical protein
MEISHGFVQFGELHNGFEFIDDAWRNKSAWMDFSGDLSSPTHLPDQFMTSSMMAGGISTRKADRASASVVLDSGGSKSHIIVRITKRMNEL